MATQEKTWNVANRLHSLKDSDNPEVNHIITGADEIYDDAKGAKQSDINAQTDAALADRYTKAETYSKEQLDALITTPDVNNVSVVATNATTAVIDILPATGEANTIYRVGNWNGTQYDPTMYALYAWNGSAYVCLAVRSFVGEVYDVSVNHPDGLGNPTPYADLAAAIGTSGANIPADIRRGGMSIKFIQGTVQSSDNKYVQYRYTSNSVVSADFTNEANWELDVTKKNLSEDFLGLLSEIKDFTIKNHAISAKGKFGTTTTYKHAALSVNEGEVYYLIGQLSTCRAAFVTTDESSSGSDVPVVPGTGIMLMSSAKQYYKFIIPQGCTHLIFNASGDYGTRCYKHYDGIEDTCDDIPTPESKMPVNSGGVVNYSRTYLEDISGFNLLDYSFGTDGKFKTTKGNKHGCLSVVSGEKYSIALPSGTSQYRYAFATSNEFSYGGDVPLVEGTNVMNFDNPPIQENIVIPEGCSYLLFQYYQGSNNKDDYSVKRYSSSMIPIVEGRISELDYYNIDRQFERLYRRDSPSTPDASVHSLRSGKTYFVVVKMSAQVNNMTISFRATSSPYTVYTTVLSNGVVYRGYNVFSFTYSGEYPCNIHTDPYSSIEWINIYDADTTLISKNDDFTKTISERAGGYKKSKTLEVNQGNAIVLSTPLKVPFVCDGGSKISVKLNDTANAFTSVILDIYDENGNREAITGYISDIINKWNTYTLPYKISAINVHTGSTSAASVDTNLTLEVLSWGSLGTDVDALLNEVSNINKNLIIPDYVEINEPNAIQEGKYVSNGALGSSSDFNLYTYQIETGKKYYLRARIPGGHSTKYIVGYSTDEEGNNIIGVAYKGRSSDVVKVPSADSDFYYQTLEIPDGAQYFHVSVRLTESTLNYLHVAYSETEKMFNAEEFNERLETLEEGVVGDNEIRKLYGSGEHIGKVRAITHAIVNNRDNEDTHIDTTRPQPLVLLHFSDAHGSATNFQRVLEYYKLFADRIDNVIQTGDIVSDYYENGISSLTDIEGFENVLNVIGNHDTRKRNSEYDDSRQWAEYAGKVAYDTYIKDYIPNWGDVNNPVVQPEDAESVGKCYYYKDYTDKKIRLIVIDNMVMTTSSANYDANQITWFESVLEDARQNDMTVVVAMHFPNDGGVYDCAFTAYNQTTGSGDWAKSQMNQFFDAVDNFKTNGGEFACYICGHKHNSILGKANNHDDQLIIAIGSTICDARGSWPRALGTKTQDFMHLMAIDTVRKNVRVLQVGVEYDCRMRHRECFCYDYVNNTIIKMSE